MDYLHQRRAIAETGINVSPLGLGTVKLGRNTGVKYPHAFDLPDDKQALSLLAQAWDLGINLLDTAPAYGHSEQRLGQLLPKLNKEWIIATKVGETFNPDTAASHYQFDPAFIRLSIEQSLTRLQRDVLDIVLIHSNGDDRRIIEQEGALDVLNELKQEGLIRATGMSTKTVSGGILTLQNADIAMVMHHIAYQQELAVLDYAADHNKAIFIKKALASGHLTQNNEQGLQHNLDFIYQHPAVTSVIMGTITPAHLSANCHAVNQAIQKASASV